MLQEMTDVKVLILFRSPVMTEAFGQLFDQMPGVTVIGQFLTLDETLNSLLVSSPDVIITGANNEEMDPVVLIRGMKEIGRGEIPIMVFTTRAGHEPELIFRSLMSGVSGYVSLNIGVEALRLALYAVRHGLTVLGPEARGIVEIALNAASGAGKILGPDGHLTAREQQVLRLMVNSLTNKEIANRLSVGVRTIEMHVAHIIEKMHVRSRTEAALQAAGVIGNGGKYIEPVGVQV